MSRLLGICLAACCTLAACSDSGPSTQPATGGVTRVLLTDAPFPFDQVARVEIHVVRIDASTTTDTIGGQGWQTLAEPRREFELLALQGGTTAFLGEDALPAGVYRSLRMVINTDPSRIILNTGATAPVQWPHAGEITVHALVESPLALGEAAGQVVIDFDVGRSFIYDHGAFQFIPFLRAVDVEATGSIGGTVWAPSNGGAQSLPASKIAVGVYRGDPVLPTSWNLIATARSAADGHYSVSFVPAGTYIVQAEPGTGTTSGIATSTGVVVTPGARTALNLTLSAQSAASITIEAPLELAVGASATLHVVITDSQGQPVSNPPVTWTLGTPHLASLTPNGDQATLTATAVGWAAIRATSNALSDSVLVQIH